MEADILTAERAKAAARAQRRVDSVEALFAAIPERFDPARVDGVDLVVQFALTGDGGGTWVVTIRDGALTVDKANVERADAAVTMRAAADDYLRIANGEMPGAEAFSTQKLSVDGDLAQAAKLAELGLM